MHDTQPVIDQHCKTCDAVLQGRYCSNCGEKSYTEHDKTIAHIAEEVLHFLTHLDGKLITTVKTMIITPGKLSDDYCDGKRRKYFKPVSLFLLVVILYLLFPVFEGLNMALSYHFTQPFYGKYAIRITDNLLATKKYSLAEVTEVFHQKGEKISKFLLFIILPVMGLVSLLLSGRKRRLFFDHFIFATESVTFFIMFGFLLLPAFLGVTKLLGIPVSTEDLGVTITAISFSVLYVCLAAKRFFKYRFATALGYSLAFLAAQEIFIQFIYKFILFSIVMKMI